MGILTTNNKKDFKIKESGSYNFFTGIDLVKWLDKKCVTLG